MSLINEALKKAQRLRNEDAAAPSTSADASSVRLPKRGKAHSANTMVLLGSGAIVLVVLSVVVTIYLVNRSPEPASRPAVASPSSEKATRPSPKTTPEATPPVTVPVAITPSTPPASENPVPAAPTVAVSPAPGPNATSLTGASPGATAAPVAPPPDAAPNVPAPTVPAATVPVATTPVATAPVATAPAEPDVRVTAFVEAVRVTGIRSSGTESRVLMNDRVYRVNDIVDRNLGVRLTKVATDSLTFSDAKGVAYVKNF